MFKKNKGFTLVEILVTLAIVAILSAGVTVVYLTQLSTKRVEADTEQLHYIDENMKLYTSYSDVFSELRDGSLLVSVSETEPDKKDTVTFEFVPEKVGSKYVVKIGNGTVNGEAASKIQTVCPKLFNYFTESENDEIKLENDDFKENGKYTVTITFNATKVSAVRDYSISNDAVSVTNANTLFD